MRHNLKTRVKEEVKHSALDFNRTPGLYPKKHNKPP